MTLPSQCSATKVAVDGDCIRHVNDQLNGLPTNATDLIVSVGGNDARRHASLLSHVKHPDNLTEFLAQPLKGFRDEYAGMLGRIQQTQLRLLVCTIYTQIPFKDPDWRKFAPLAIAQFNEIITSEAKRFSIPILPLHEVCTETDDFSTFSPIEPSTQGGQKIVDRIVEMTLN
ncbi:MAG: SGNH/GDSL hydrolase family protein [Litoreibacter sp.]